MIGDPVESLRAQLAGDPAMRAVVAAILDRSDRRGALPKRISLRCCAEEQEAAVRLLSAAAVRPARSPGLSVLLDLSRADDRLRAEGAAGLAEVLYAAAGRVPKNLPAEAAALAASAARLATELAAERSGAAAGFLRHQAERLASCRGEMFELARSEGIARLEEELHILARSIGLAEANDRPVRLANFARRATGSTKGLRAGDQRYARLTDALLRYVPGLADRVAAEGLSEPADLRRLALECLGVFRNETPIDVLCYGDVLLEKEGRRLDTVAVHHELGEPCRLLHVNLRGARVVDVRAERVVSVENETTFNDYVDWVRASRRREVVLLSEGQANWAVVRLLRMLADAAPSLPIVHWGDMDRFGVLILRSLRRRTGLAIEPWWMDVPTFTRFVPAGLPLPEGEREEIDALLAASPRDVAGDLLEAIRHAGRWVEQETVADAMLASPEHARS